MSILSAEYFHDEADAYRFVEAIVWPDGPTCPHCGNANPARIYAIVGEKARIGLRTCADCRKQFTVKVGTIFESSHVPLHKWMQAMHLLCSSKKGISSHQLHRLLDVQYKTAWFMSHRIRHAMRSGSLAVPMGGAGGSGIVEADETFIGRKKGMPKKRAYHHKNAVLSLVERGGSVRSFVVDKADSATIMPIVRENVAKEARVMTDEAKYYNKVGAEFAEHGTVNHNQGEYVRGDALVNTLENFYSVFKHGMKGVYQHCSEKHLHRYVGEFDFRYNNRSAKGVEDEARTGEVLRGARGKRLKYRHAIKDDAAASDGEPT